VTVKIFVDFQNFLPNVFPIGDVNMKKHLILIFVLFIAAFGLQACKDSRQEANEDQVELQEETQEEADQLADETREEAQEIQEETGDVADDTGNDVETGLDEAGSEIKDAGITTAVKAKFAVDDVVKAFEIDVDTENGIVTLKGTVDSKVQSTRATEIAETVDGVKQVRNELIVSKS
jgi:hyperosmotically inducible protein